MGRLNHGLTMGISHPTLHPDIIAVFLYADEPNVRGASLAQRKGIRPCLSEDFVMLRLSVSAFSAAENYAQIKRSADRCLNYEW
jgi:hypothetical protein